MKKQGFNLRKPLRFKHFSNKSYALFSCLGKVVLIGVLSVSTLKNAKADGISIRLDLAEDSLEHAQVRLDEVIVTGSRAPLTAAEAAKMVTIITREDIEQAPVESVSDLLKMATGVDVRQRGAFGVQTDISINGGTFDQIAILLNGISLSSPQTGHNAADFPISLSDIERIEIVEGSAARLMGTSAFAGAVNIVTRSANRTEGNLAVQAGQYGTIDTSAGIAIANGNLRSRISGGYGQSDGAIDNTDYHRRNLYWQGAYGSHDNQLKWQAGITSKDYGASTFYSAKYDNQYETTRRYIASLGGDIAIPHSTIMVQPTVFAHRDIDHYQLIHGKEGAENGENYHRTDVYGAQLNAHMQWALGRTAIGSEIRRDRIISTAYGQPLDESEWTSIRHSTRQYDKRGQRTSTSLFVEHDIVAGNLTISAGLLANKNTGLDGRFRFYPGIDISLRPTNHWKFFVSWNKALRLPTFTDLYISNSIQLGDIALRPERNHTMRIGTQYVNGSFTARLSSFYSVGRDMIDWVYTDETSTRYQAMNIGKLDNMGIEAEAAFHPRKTNPYAWISNVAIGYAFIHQSHDTDLPIWKSLYALEYLRHKFTAQIDHKIWKDLSATWNLRWQQRLNGYHPYAKIDAKIMWKKAHYTAFLQADNLTNHQYYDLGGVCQPGLWIMCGAEFRLW